MWSISNVFGKGHRLRLEVSSRNFPRFDRNLNTGEDPAVAVNSIPASNTVYHDGEHPSALVVPIVPSRSLSFAKKFARSQTLFEPTGRTMVWTEAISRLSAPDPLACNPPWEAGLVCQRECSRKARR